jgi:glycosyltransferase involved in cell wall biosynthesis
MRICIIVNKFVHGMGISEYLNGLCGYLRRKHDIEIITPVSDFGYRFVKKVPYGSRLPGLKYFLPYRTGKLRKYDIVVSNYPTLTAVKTGMGIAKSQGIPHVIIDYGVAESALFANLRARAAHYIGIKSMKRYYSRADAVFSISRFLQRNVESLGLESEVILGGIDYKRFQKKKNTGILKKFGLGRESYAVFLGRVSPHKGIHLLIEVFERLNWPIKLVVVGSHPIGGYGRRLKRMGGDVVFTGAASDDEVNELLQNCAMYVTASLWEGLNLPLLEAQACGKPVIAFDICAHPEVVLKNRTGFLVKPLDLNDFADRISMLVKDKKKRKQMGERARTFAKKFDWSIIGKNAEKKLLGVLK